VDHFPAKADQQDFRAFLFDYEAAFYHATQYLISLGHHRIALLNLDWPDYLPVLMRTRGYHRALADGGVAESLVFAVPNSSLAGSQSTLHRLLNVRPRPTAILCYDDTLAALLYRAAAEYQISIPQELSIIACGDLPLAEYLRPALSSFSLPIDRLAEAAAHHLLNHTKEHVTATFEPLFVPRASVLAL
jgi:LacI family transcriptional regulator